MISEQLRVTLLSLKQISDRLKNFAINLLSVYDNTESIKNNTDIMCELLVRDNVVTDEELINYLRNL